MDCAGGGGYGDPGGRDPALVEGDLREGKVTPEGAERDYGIGRASVPRSREPSTAYLLRRAQFASRACAAAMARSFTGP